MSESFEKGRQRPTIAASMLLVLRQMRQMR